MTHMEAAYQISSEMSHEDAENFTTDSWREGVSLMIKDEWAHLDAEGVLEELAEIVRHRLQNPDKY